MKTVDLALIINIYFIFFLMYTESIYPLINELDKERKKNLWINLHYTLSLLAIICSITPFLTAFQVVGSVKYISDLTPYMALIAAIVPYILFLRELVPQEVNKSFDRYNVHFHAFIIAIFTAVGVFVAELNPSNLVDSLSFFVLIVSAFHFYDKKFKKSIWIIHYGVLSLITLFFMVTSLLTFSKIIHNIPIVTKLTPYFALVAAIIAYLLVLYEFSPKKIKYKIRNRNKLFFLSSIIGIVASLLVYPADVNPSSLVDGFSFIAFAITTLFYFSFDDWT
ncbi:hypothetical protein ACTFSO_18875 [Bacillus cereus group sp. MYBK120-1]|uniref:hypothetical protein n=1 Tax=Bacillus cereus group TaxID=86661 RepID=UPI00234C2A12|nr:hypothetical protein [Bacillus cereus]MDC7729673.1 hypothetical protein [Bacillus cereus]